MVSEIIFPFWEILVENIFGSVALSLAAVAVIILLILGLCRCSWVFMLYWMMFYVMVTMTLYLGAIGLVLCFLVSVTFFVVQMIRLFAPER